MKRRLLAMLAGVSLALCVATIVLWMRSIHCTEFFIAEKWTTPGENTIVNQQLSLISDRGLLAINFTVTEHHAFTSNRNYASQPIPDGLPADGYYWTHHRLENSSATNEPDFAMNIQPTTAHYFQFDSKSWEMRAPHWFVALVAGVPVAALAIYRVGRRRKPRGEICRNCGYDLRATPDRCPECGTVPAKNETNSK